MIYLIITTCINNKIGIKNDDHRKHRYIESIQQLLNLIKNDPSIKPIIVENNGLRTTYLNQLNCDIVYTQNNKLNFLQKAQNELLDIKEVITRYNIQDNDTIIKITGRYKLLNSSFINLVKTNNHDAFVKFYNVCTKTFMKNDCVLGLFAIKCKYLKNFNYQFIKSPECEFADYVRKNITNLLKVQNLNLEYCLAETLNILIV